MRINAIRIFVSIVIFCSLISIPGFGEKLTGNKNLQNQLFENNILSNTWSVESVDTFGDVGVDTDIAVASDNTVFISYYDIVKKDLKCARLTNNEWNVIVVDSEGDVGRFTIPLNVVSETKTVRELADAVGQLRTGA